MNHFFAPFSIIVKKFITSQPKGAKHLFKGVGFGEKFYSPILLTACLFIMTFPAFGQVQLPAPTEIYGKVIDATTKDPLPYVNIQLVGTLKGTMTDPKGEFFIKTIEKVDSINFSMIGYDPRTVPVIRGKTQELNITMGSGEMKLVEITVKAKKRQKHVVDTAANYVYYQVLKNKESNRSEHINTYQYDSYEKLELSLLNPAKWLVNMRLLKPFSFVFRNRDTSETGEVIIPGILKETISKVYYRRHPKSLKKFIIADAITGVDDPSIGKLANYQFAEINVYDNLYVLAAVSFTAPFSPAGISTYYYYLTDTAQIDGRTSYKLHFVGKVKEDLALKGYAWIDSATWGVRYIVFRPNEKANFNFINDYTIRQDYIFLNDKDWLLKGEQVRTVGSALKRKLEMKLLVTKTYERRNFKVDEAIPDSILKGPETEILLDSARHRSKAFWDSTRFIPLTPQEVEVYRISDTIKLVPAWKTLEFMGRFFSVAYADAGPISIGKILNFVSFNNVEGWRLRFGFETNPRFQHIGTPANTFLRKFYFTGYGAYGLGDRIWQYMGLTRLMLPRRNDHWQTLELMYRYDMRIPGQDPDQTLLTFDNVVNLISGTILTKIMRTREFRFTYEKQWVQSFSTIFSTNDKVFYDIPGIFDFTHPDGETAIQVPRFHVTEFTLDNRYAYDDQYIVSGAYRYFVATKYPVLLFRYTAGIVNLENNDFNFHNLRLILKQRLSSPIGASTYT
jgi:hypothetical protein